MKTLNCKNILERLLKNEKKISIIVAVYNAEKYLENCVNSIINQTYEKIEVILVNDGSTDNSLKVCYSISNQYNNIVVIDKENGGCYSAWNEGLKLATGELIGFVDNDDYIVPSMYLELESLMDETNADIVCCGRYRNIENHNDFSNMDLANNQKLIFTGEDAVKHLFTETTLIKPAVWDKLYKREIFENEEFPNTFFEDAGLTYKLLLKAEKVAVTKKQLYAYSVRGGSMVTSPWNQEKTNSYSYVTNEAIKYLQMKRENLVPFAFYWQIQFGIEAWERCLMSTIASSEDYQLIKKNVSNSYAQLNMKDLNFPMKKDMKKRIEFWLFRYMPNFLCKIKKKELK